MTRIIFLCFLLFTLKGYSQNYINKSREQVKKELDAYVTSNVAINPSFTETDSSILLSVKGPGSLPADFTYGFDKEGRCNSEKVVTYCDSCYTKFLNAALARKQYHWKKINGNQYVSDFASKMLLELSLTNNDFSFIILRTDWSRQMYNQLKGK